MKGDIIMEKLIRVGSLEIVADKMFLDGKVFEIYENGCLLSMIIYDTLYYFEKSFVKNIPSILELEEFSEVTIIKQLKENN